MDNRNLAYRPDIDGLRAIAVIAVVLSHAFPNFLPGGFIGVDIFFVISGFLITAILVQEMETRRFSVAAFYGRRIRRLFPALALVGSCCLVASYCLLLEDEYRQLGWHTAAGAGFVANIALWAETGYFERAAELKPLLHLWSLGVEEQFYLLWPLFMALALKARNSLQTLAIGLLLLSFGMNLITSGTDPNSAFFLPHTRFWELLTGAVLAIATRAVQTNPQGPEPNTKNRLAFEVVALVGIALIFLSLVVTEPSDAFPGWLALLPVMGSACLMAAGPQTWMANRLLSTRLLVWIGLISYPLYLWHWPLLSFSRIILGEEPSAWMRLLLVGSAILLAMATYRLLELPLRKAAGNTDARRRLTVLLAATMGFLLLAGLMAHQRIPHERLHRISHEISAAARDWYYPGDAKAKFEGTYRSSVLFFGDSYIQQLHPRIEQLYRDSKPDRGARFHTAGGCTPIPGITRLFHGDCGSFIEQGFAMASDPDIKKIVIGGSWLGMIMRGDYVDQINPGGGKLDLSNETTLTSVLNRLEQRIGELVRNGKEVFVVLNPPGGGLASPESQYRARLSATGQLQEKSVTMETHRLRTGAINSRIRALAERAGAKVIDPATWICSDHTCQFTNGDGIPYFKDPTHFRASFIRWQLKALDHLVATPEPAP